MVPDDFFQLYSRKNNIEDFGAWGTSRYYEKKNFFFYEFKLDALVESGMLITNIIMGTLQTPLFLK
jgi:hypothetical protein